MSLGYTLLSGGLVMGIAELAVLDAKARRRIRERREKIGLEKPRQPKTPKGPQLGSGWERNPPPKAWESPKETATEMLARKRAEKPQPHGDEGHICTRGDGCE